MKKALIIGITFLLIICCTMCRKANPGALNDDNNFDPRLSGGAATVFDISSGSFSNPILGMDARNAHVHVLGDKVFSQSFVAAPAPFFGGLGPVFNNTACTNCHHNDGIGFPTVGGPGSALLIRISIPGTDEHGGPNPAPGFGLQVQNMSLFGVSAEAQVNISYVEQIVNYLDGNSASLRTPTYTLTNPYIPLPAGYMTSPRMAPALAGMGLLENIPESTILSFVATNNANGGPIKGHTNYVYNPYTQKTELGRFGLKSNTSSLQMQIATAFQQDMGITSYVQPYKSVYGQEQWAGVTDTATTDIADSILDAVTFYVRSLAVPARRNVTDATVVQGEKMFMQLNCSGCHIPTMYTGVDITFPQLSNQRIHPYTDLLVHDMGAALADNRPDCQANGNEWRTAPLWGIGLLEKTNGVPYYLHDGRARTLEEAILWHGGEAQTSRDQFTKLSKSDRDAVIAFLQSL
jgi:CxxC motif-containing protein (DUF1111 family)